MREFWHCTGGGVILAGCDSSKLAQNWTGSSLNPGDLILNLYSAGCLSSNKGPNPQPVIMVDGGGGCNGNGGQAWFGFP
jgi:hypothetical protein